MSLPPRETLLTAEIAEHAERSTPTRAYLNTFKIRFFEFIMEASRLCQGAATKPNKNACPIKEKWEFEESRSVGIGNDRSACSAISAVNPFLCHNQFSQNSAKGGLTNRRLESYSSSMIRRSFYAYYYYYGARSTGCRGRSMRV